MNGKEQKILLFADDILLYLSNPEQSFTHLISLLEKYGSFSGYKLNVSKTQVLCFGYSPPCSLTAKFSLQWDAVSIRYLGVNIPKNLLNLFSVNFLPINQVIKEDIRRWSAIPLLGFGSRIQSIKMNILPRLLYLFQSLPIEFSDQYFQEWDKLISRYIWQGKKPRIKYHYLQLTRESGGVALPSLKDYYIAA